MLGDILRDPIRWSSHIGFIQRRPPTLQLPSLACVGNPLLNIAYAIEILIEFTLVGTADLATQIPGMLEDRIEHALIPSVVFILEESIECQ